MPEIKPLKLFAPPPLIYATFLILAYGLNFVWAVPLLPPPWGNLPAMLLTLGGALIFFSARRNLLKAGTSPNPARPVATLVTTGAYLRTRNPIYLAFTWIYIGLGFWMNSMWALVFFPILILVMTREVIVREEVFLEATFGKAYRDYKARTRRWM
jgi:protein-S-isoprenylcysteine O-methyltransferase Ste14